MRKLVAILISLLLVTQMAMLFSHEFYVPHVDNLRDIQVEEDKSRKKRR